MNSRLVLRITALLLALTVCAALAWFLAGRRAQPAGGGDPSYALITAPQDGDILLLGDPVYVKASGFLSKRDLGQTQLLIDGSPYLVADGPQSPSEQSAPGCSSESAEICGSVESTTLWIPSTPGRHLLHSCFQDNQNEVEMWQICTDPISVTIVDPAAQADAAGAYTAALDETIQSVAEKFGLPPVLVAAANPEIDPGLPIPPDTQIEIPAAPPPAEDVPAGASSARAFASVLMTVDLPVEKVYCYYSLGEDYWTRLPAAPQSFAYPLNGQLDLSANFRSVTVPADGGFLALECWGWSGSALVELGSGQSSLPPGSEAQLRGDHFQLNGSLAPAPNPPAHPMGPTPPPTPPPGAKLMPPIKVRRTGILGECINHFPPAWEFIGTLFCKGAVEKSQFILIWDRALFALEGFTTEIQGYKVYKTNSTGIPTLIKTIPDPEQRILILTPDVITSPPPTFCVRTYFESRLSTPTCYVAAPETMGLATVSISALPSSVNPISYFVDSESKMIHDCGGSGGLGSDADPQFIARLADQVLVGYFHRFEDGCVELDDTYFRGSVLFDLSKIEGPLSKATLTFIQGKTFSGAPGTFGSGGQSCADMLNISTELTTGGISAFDPYRALSSLGFSGLIHKVDVTEAVRGWMLGERNLGFILTGRDESFPGENDSCWSFYGPFSLTATYFTSSK